MSKHRGWYIVHYSNDERSQYAYRYEVANDLGNANCKFAKDRTYKLERVYHHPRKNHVVKS